MLQLLKCAAAATALAVATANPFQLSTAANGAYSLSVDGFAAFKLNSGDTSVTSAGQVFSSGKGNLVQGAASSYAGSDAWGTFNATSTDWTGNGTVLMRTTFKVYDNVPAIIFEQSFPSGIAATGGDYKAKDDVGSAFPSFALPSAPGLAFMQFNGPFLDAGSSGPRFGTFQTGADLISGLTAGSGPLVLYDSTGSNAVVLSAASSFMAASSAVGTTAGGASVLNYGVMGSATAIPAWYTMEFVAWAADTGVNTAIQAWGGALLNRYNKPHGLSKLDFTNTHLGYNTDHGEWIVGRVGGTVVCLAV